jgi:hypothetical protein
LPEVETQWKEKRIPGVVSNYWHALHGLRFSTMPIMCYQYLGELSNVDEKIAPLELMEHLAKTAQQIKKEVDERPIKSYGVEIPDKAVISLGGTQIRIQTRTLVQIFQLVLAPILMLWLGALYNTRYRETRLIEGARSIADLYPHGINIYLSGEMPTLRKKSWSVYYLKKLIPLIPAFIRVSVLAVFILPPVISYTASLFYLELGKYWFLAPIAGFFVITSTLFNVITEFQAWHASKSFPSAKCLDPSRMG